MTFITLTISAVLAIVAGILILFWPKMLRIGIGIYLLLFGILKIIELNLG